MLIKICVLNVVILILIIWTVWGNTALMVDVVMISSRCIILLSHRPELFETYAACGVDLVLSGHAYGRTSGYRLLVDWLHSIRGCSPNMMLDYIQMAARIWWSAAVLETAPYHSVSITVRRSFWWNLMPSNIQNPTAAMGNRPICGGLSFSTTLDY